MTIPRHHSSVSIPFNSSPCHWRELVTVLRVFEAPEYVSNLSSNLYVNVYTNSK